MRHGARALGHAGQHAREFGDPLNVVQYGDRSDTLVLGHAEVPVGEAGDLRQVRDDEDLPVLRQPRQPPPYGPA